MDGRAYLSRIVAQLFDKDRKSLDMELDGLIKENFALGNPKGGFMFAGEFHSLLSPAERVPIEKKLLAKPLHAAMRDYLGRIKLMDREIQRISTGLLTLLAPCKDAQDVRDALPESVVMLHSDLSALPRQRPEAWPFADRPMQMVDYQKTADLLSFYSSNQYLL